MQIDFYSYGVLRRTGKTLAASFLLFGAAHADQIDIVALGDSLTHGYGLVEQDGFVPRMRGWLAEQGSDVRLINAGVSGDTTAGGLARVDWTLTSEIDAMIVELGGNDVLRGIAPEVARANLEGILRIAANAQVEVLLVGMEAPGNYGPDYKTAFDAIYPDLADKYGTLYAESFFAGLPGNDPASVRPYMQADGIHPNSKGVTLIVDELGPYVLELIDRARR